MIDSQITLKTNHHVRPLVAWIDLPESARPDFEYVIATDDGTPPAAWPDEAYTPRFVLYRGSWYDVHEFQRISRESSRVRDPLAYSAFGITVSDDSPIAWWDGAQTESAFSAVVVKWAADEWGEPGSEYVVVGYAHW